LLPSFKEVVLWSEVALPLPPVFGATDLGLLSAAAAVEEAHPFPAA
jgi:hypothetical protein